eukprot:1821214-Pyramimonas_sp.AAC.1
MCLKGPASILSDCANMVNDYHAAPDLHAHFRKACAGHIVQARADEAHKFLENAIKAKAHLCLNEAGLSDDEKYRRTGNRLADLGAKAAVLMHPIDRDVLDETDLRIKSTDAFCKLAVKLLPRFPSLKEHGEVEYVKPDRSKAAA